MPKYYPARLHIIAAMEAPVAVVIRRKPSHKFHIMLWNLTDDTFTHGSWFSGKLYPLRSDISWDGRYMSYLAMGGSGVWNGICELPFLKTLVEWDNIGTYSGGAVWMERDVIYRNLSHTGEPRIVGPLDPKYRFEDLPSAMGEDTSIIYHRLYRDGFRPSVSGKIIDQVPWQDGWQEVAPFESGGVWTNRLHSGLPGLTTELVGYGSYLFAEPRLTHAIGFEGRSGYLFRFEIEGRPDLLGPQVEWATWASTGDLLFSRHGSVHRMSSLDIAEGREPARFDLDDLTPPNGTPHA